MNINQSINKLLYALKLKGQLYKINSFQFYSENIDKYCTKYQVLKRELVEKVIEFIDEYEDEDYEEEKEYKYNVAYESYNKIDLLKYLAEELKGSEANGK